GLSGQEGTFAICSFWMVSALSEIGEHRKARELCEKMLSYASPLHLYAEEIDPKSGRHLGNFPQAFTHLALINAVMHVIRADHEQSNFRLANETLIAGASLRDDQVHRMRGELGPDEGARAYAAELAEHLELDDVGMPVIDVIHLGLGPDGHTASLFPDHESL